MSKLKTKFEEIVDCNAIGSSHNPINLNTILQKAGKEELKPASEDNKRVLLLNVDMQNSFMEKGELGVSHSLEDVKNVSKWIYNNMEYITKIAFSLDTHQPFQIFFPCWWIDEKGHNPDPFTIITLADLDNNKWRAVIEPTWSREYVQNLEKKNFKLCIWPYHCLQGTIGHALECQLANMINFHSVAKRSMAIKMVKGTDPKTEMYGILKAEYDPQNKVNIDFLNKLREYEIIVITGEAKSHCVRRSIEQIVEYYKDDLEMTRKIYIMQDCMSSIQGFEADTEKAFVDLKNQYKLNLVNSTEFQLKDVI